MSVVPSDPWEPITPAMWAELHAKWPDGERLWWAIQLATDFDTCAALLSGRAVPSSKLDPIRLVQARQASLVQLLRPLDLFPSVDASEGAHTHG